MHPFFDHSSPLLVSFNYISSELRGIEDRNLYPKSCLFPSVKSNSLATADCIDEVKVLSSNFLSLLFHIRRNAPS